LSCTQKFTDVAGVSCGEKFLFNTYAKQVTGERSWKLGHSKSPDFNMCNYYYDYLYETMIILCKRPKFLPKNERTFKEKLPTFEDKVHCSFCQKLFSEGIRPGLQLDVSI
jgi:hypothetical protein